MPSVGTRRTTRILGARVLRSGRKLWAGPVEAKKKRLPHRESWIGLVDDSRLGGTDVNGCKASRYGGVDVGFQQEADAMDIDEVLEGCKLKKCGFDSSMGDGRVLKIRRSVYHRKRKRIDNERQDLLDVDKAGAAIEDTKYGKKFVRKEWRKRIKGCSEAESCGGKRIKGCSEAEACGRILGSSRLEVCLTMALVATVKSCCNVTARFACLLASILRYSRMAAIRLSQLSSFLSSEPIAHVYSSCGIHFLQGSACHSRLGVCCIFSVSSFIPVFSVDFSAIPYCFKHLHLKLHLRLGCLPFSISSIDDKAADEELQCSHSEGDQCGSKDVPSRENKPRNFHCEAVQSGSRSVASGNENPVNRGAAFSTVVTSRRSTRIMQLKNGVNSHLVKRRRRRRGMGIKRSLRSRKGKHASDFVVPDVRVNGCVASVPLSPLVCSNKASSVWKTSTVDAQKVRFVLLHLKEDFDSASCLANLLINESDRCYKKVGVIMLEVSAVSKQWFLAVKMEGITRYIVKVQKNMSPCSCNRFTRAIIWTVDDDLKLEFPSRQDWVVFKELYQECFNRNAQVPTISTIPIPVVCEVSSYMEKSDIIFRRPDSYITVKEDEVSRALVKGSTNYDMDSEDEEWIRKLNHESFEEQQPVILSSDNFESMVYAFEKGFYLNPDSFSDEKAAIDLCLNLGRREVLEAVHRYWMKKRKQKGSALVRIFQPGRAQVILNSVFRKKRSLKRKPKHVGKGKQHSFWQAIIAEPDALEVKSNILKIEGAKKAASRSEDLAILKRRRAQLLMEKADLATYKATMALRIAEAAEAAE